MGWVHIQLSKLVGETQGLPLPDVPCYFSLQLAFKGVGVLLCLSACISPLTIALPSPCVTLSYATLSQPQVCQAMCTLLAMVLPRVPNSVLRSKFVGCSALLCRVLEIHRQQV